MPTNRATLDELYSDRALPLIFGHRGASADAPMNTLPAFELAVTQGADGIELDVRLSKDRQVIVIHDAQVDQTTDGHGAAAHKTLSELRELDAGSWFAPAFRNTRIPTLDEVFEAVGKRLFINVELKSETLRTDGLEQAVADRIRHFGLARRVIVSSFNPQALRRFCRLLPEVPVGFLYAPDVPRYLRLLAVGLRHAALHPHHSMINAAYVDWARKQNYRIHTWTVNEPARALTLRGLGVEALITDSPRLLHETLRG
ncbi:MAG: glycerophosphodiester phosphodiesterase [Chloroflexi bacterium]|nr:glycerophosphodiester phosphodiesterase [Chloroflexota bacterium]